MAQHSDLKVYPVTWEKNLKANLKKDWEIRYTFYCPQFPAGQVIRFKGMNRAGTLVEKQKITRELIELELSNLRKGFNPILKKYETSHNSVNEFTPFLAALNIAATKSTEGMKIMMADAISLINPIAVKYGSFSTPIGQIRKRDIKLILDEISAVKSNDRTNKVRACLIILFNYFVDMDIFEFNFVKSIKRLVHVPEQRKILRQADKEAFAILKQTNYKFWRFCTMFYYSGSRLEEFIRVDTSRIDLKNQKFQIFEKKGRQYHWVWKPINTQALPLWAQILSETTPEKTFIFGNGLSPAAIHTERDYVTRKWRLWAKNKLGIQADLYALKHTFLNDVTSKYGISAAKDLAGHSDEKTTRTYAVDYHEMILDRQKNVDVSLIA